MCCSKKNFWTKQKTINPPFKLNGQSLTDIGFRHIWDNQGTLSRVALLKSIPSFPDMSEIEKIKYILSSIDLDICKIYILGVKKMYDLNQTLKQSL